LTPYFMVSYRLTTPPPHPAIMVTYTLMPIDRFPVATHVRSLTFDSG